MDCLKFSQMLSSRLCHDLITPIGAVNTGIELLRECSEQDRGELLSISQHSAETAARRLVYYRAAFGYSTTALMTRFDDLEKIITRFLSPIKIEFNWLHKPFLSEQVKDVIDLPLLSRIILNLILIQAETASMGGCINFDIKISNTQLELNFDVQGKLTVLRQEIQDAVCGLLDDDSQSPHTVQAFMASMLLNEYGATISHIHSDKSQFLLQVVKQLNHQNVRQSNSNKPNSIIR